MDLSVCNLCQVMGLLFLLTSEMAKVPSFAEGRRAEGGVKGFREVSGLEELVFGSTYALFFQVLCIPIPRQIQP